MGENQGDSDLKTSLEKELTEEDIQDMDGPELAEERTELALERSEMAEQRTDWAQHRTLLANERNFSAWLRTGLSAMGGGLALARLLGDEAYGLIPRGIGIFLVLFGAGVCGLAVWRYRQVTVMLEAEGLPVTPEWVVALLVGALGLMVIFLLVLIFLM
jgi:putative membrane protein